MHNLLPFVAKDRHTEIIRTLGRWLKPEGRAFIWNAVRAKDEREGNQLSVIRRISEIKDMIEDGRIEIEQPKAAVFARLERNIDDSNRPGQQSYASPELLAAMIGGAGLNVRSTEVVHQQRDLPGGSLIGQRYAMVIAGRA